MADRFGVVYGGKPLSPAQAEERLPFKARQIRDLCATGELECVVVNGRYFIYPAAIEAWIRQHLNQPAA